MRKSQKELRRKRAALPSTPFAAMRLGQTLACVATLIATPVFACKPDPGVMRWSTTIESNVPLSALSRHRLDEVARAFHKLSESLVSITTPSESHEAIKEVREYLRAKNVLNYGSYGPSPLSTAESRNGRHSKSQTSSTLLVTVAGMSWRLRRADPPIDPDAGHPIRDAIKSDHFDGLQSAVRTYGPNYGSFTGNTPIKWAVAHDSYLFTRYLIDQGADIPSGEFSDGSHLGAYAARNGNLPMLRLLERSGLKLQNQVNSALFAATCGKTVGTVGTVGISGEAVFGGNAAVVQHLLASGADPNSGRKKGSNEYYETPLLCAVARQDKEMIDVLLTRGAGINNVNQHGDTPVFALSKNPQLLQHLASRGASLTHVGWSGNTLLHYPKNLDEQTIKVLLDAGSNIEAKSKEEGYRFLPEGLTPLLVAARDGDMSVYQALLKQGANPDARDSDGRSALDIAALYNRVEFVQAALASGSRPASSPKTGRTALHAAAAAGPFARTACPLTSSEDAALARAIHEKTILIKALLAAGADPKAQDMKGRRPIDYLNKLGTSKQIELLLQPN